MEEDGLSIIDIGRIILGKRVIVYILFGVIFVLISLLIAFVYNPLNVKYEISFNYSWIGIENDRYSNKEAFNYYDIISREKINNVKESNSLYKQINIDKVLDNIEIYKNEKDYKIIIKGECFSNDSQAESFLIDLIYLPYNKNISLEYDFNANLVGYNRAKRIATGIDYLKEQEKLILDGYSSLISYFGDIKINNTFIGSIYKKYKAFIDNDTISKYKYLAYQNYYMTKEEYADITREKEALLTEKRLLEERKVVLLNSLKNIYESSSGDVYLDSAVTSYLDSLHMIDSKLISIDESLYFISGALNGKYNELESELFIKNLDAYRDVLQEYTLEYADIVKEVLKENSSIHINKINIEGRINLLFTILISFILAFIISGAIGFIIGYTKKDLSTIRK